MKTWKTLGLAALCALLMVTAALAADPVPVSPNPGVSILTPVDPGTSPVAVMVAPDGQSMTIPAWWGFGTVLTLTNDVFFVKNGWQDPFNQQPVKLIVVFTDSDGDGEADGAVIALVYGTPPSAEHPLSGQTKYTLSAP